MSRIKADVLRDFETPETSDEVSTHGSQREDSIITSFLAGSGWGREASAAAKAAFLPDVVPVKEGNGRGRGATLIDAFRVNPKRACGGDFLSLKAPTARKSGEFPSSVELFKGTRSTLICCLEAVRQNRKFGKAFPLAVVHTGGEVFAPTLIEWAILDFGSILSTITNRESWETYCDIPVKPLNDRPRGRGGSPASVWITLLRREKAGCVNGVQKYRYAQDDDGHYATLNTSVSARSGTRFIAGSPADFAMDVDAATVLR
jgi:hypothetical protein